MDTAPRKGSISSSSSRDGAAQFCNRLGCCGRLNYTKGIKNKSLEKPKSLKPSFSSSSGKEVTSSSSKSLLESRKKLSSKIETTPKESRNVQNESETQQLNVPARNHTERTLKSRNTESNKAVLMPVSKTTEGASSSTRIRKVYHDKNGFVNQASQSNNHGVMENNTVKKRFVQGESSSSSKGKRVIALSSNEGQSRNLMGSRGSGVSSVRTRRSINHLDGDNLQLVQSSNVILDMPQTEILWPSVESSSSDSSLGGDHTASDTSTDDSIVRYLNQNGIQGYNIDGIADVLLALDRIEQDEGLTYEQLLSLEANLFLGGLNFYDRHRDMRLDIDNMSYEELLVLEEKMGTVSTALSEEDLSKCIGVSTYGSSQSDDGKKRCSWGADDSKCSICQEEFIRGDEIGRVGGCGHGYHALCINQWLRLKNWCPICKASPSSSSPAKKL